MSRHPLPPLDDISALRQHLDMPHLRYLDVSVSNALDQAVRRWPLLTETESTHALDAALRAPSLDRENALAQGQQA